MIFWLVSRTDNMSAHVICNGNTREDAKRVAHKHLGANSDQYMVLPLTKRGDFVSFDMEFPLNYRGI